MQAAAGAIGLMILDAGAGTCLVGAPDPSMELAMMGSFRSGTQLMTSAHSFSAQLDPMPSETVFGFPALPMGGLRIAAMTRRQSAVFLDAAGSENQRCGRTPFYVTSANGEVLSRVESDPAIKALFLAADMIHADGQAMVLASRLGRTPVLPERVATTDLFHDVAKLAETSGTSFYLLGGTQEVMRATVNAVQSLYPKLNIVGTRNGYFAATEEDEVVEAINRVRPGILWIGMGVPREQAFVVRNLTRLTEVGVIKTSGGLFDFLSGRRSRAPQWMQSAGLEWLYRTILEPRRLSLRYLTTNPHAMIIMMRRSGR